MELVTKQKSRAVVYDLVYQCILSVNKCPFPGVAVGAVSELAVNLIFNKYCKLGYPSRPLGKSTFDLELPLLLLCSVHCSPYASSSLAAHDSCFPCCSLLSLKDLFI